MTTLYARPNPYGTEWSDFNAAPRYGWNHTGMGGVLYEIDADLNGGTILARHVTLEQAERSLRQLGHQIGEWDD